MLIMPLVHLIDITSAHWHGDGAKPFASKGVFHWWWTEGWDIGIAGYLCNMAKWRIIAFAASELSARTGTPLCSLIIPFTFLIMIFGPSVMHRLQAVLPRFASQWLTMNQECIGMFPLFVVGLLTPFRQLLRCVSPSRPVRVFAASLLVVWCAVPYGPWASIIQIWQSLPFRGTWHNEVWQAFGCSYSWALTWTWSLFKSLSLAFMVLFVILCLCPRTEHWFTSVGKHTIYAYLLHLPSQRFIMAVWRFAPQPASVHSCMLLWGVVYLVSAGLALSLMLALTSSPVRWMTGPIIQPEWLGKLLPPTASSFTK